MPGMQPQSLVDYIEPWKAKVWETFFFKEFNGLIKPTSTQENYEWEKQLSSLQVLK
jgi:hypothetical protein